LWLAFVARNDWSVFPVILGLVTVGLGQGALVTRLFNVLVTASPKALAGDVGSLRGTTPNLAAAMGTAVMGALVVALVSAMILRNRVDHPVIPPECKRTELAQRFALDDINFISNAQLLERLPPTPATPEPVEEAVRINTASRLRALKIGFLVLSGLALLAIFPCRWLPDYRPGAIPSDQPRGGVEPGERKSACRLGGLTRRGLPGPGMMPRGGTQNRWPA
jgi:hypothetical protein